MKGSEVEWGSEGGGGGGGCYVEGRIKGAKAARGGLARGRELRDSQLQSLLARTTTA